MTTTPTITWAAQSRRARAFRIAHAAWAIVGLASVGYIWICAALTRRDRLVAAAVAVLSVEGVALVVGHGNCPFGPLQQRLGDPVPLFELVLPPRAAKAAIPVLFATTVAGIVALAARQPRGRRGRNQGSARVVVAEASRPARKGTLA